MKTAITSALAYTVINLAIPQWRNAITRAAIGQLTGIGIATITNPRHVGRVFVFDVTPHRRQDPPVIVCNEIDMDCYYINWRMVSNGAIHSERNAAKHYDEMMVAILQSARGILRHDEVTYLRNELMIFKNDYFMQWVQ